MGPGLGFGPGGVDRFVEAGVVVVHGSDESDHRVAGLQIRNVVLPVVEVGMDVAQEYAGLVRDPAAQGIFERIRAEYDRTERALRAVLPVEGRAERHPGLSVAIDLRDAAVSRLGRLQVRLLEAPRSATSASEGAPDAEGADFVVDCLLSINALAAGLRMTG